MTVVFKEVDLKRPIIVPGMPTLTALSALSAATLVAKPLAVSAVKPLRARSYQTRRDFIAPTLQARTEKIVADFVQQLGSGEVVYTLADQDRIDSRIGATWTNWGEDAFEVASKTFMLWSIPEETQTKWWNIWEKLDETAIRYPVTWTRQLQWAIADGPLLCAAWEDLLAEAPDRAYSVPTVDENDDPVGSATLTAAELITYAGYSFDDCKPVVVICDRLSRADSERLAREDEVFLDGYRITSIEMDNNVPFVHIETNEREEA